MPLLKDSQSLIKLKFYDFFMFCWSLIFGLGRKLDKGDFKGGLHQADLLQMKSYNCVNRTKDSYD